MLKVSGYLLEFRSMSHILYKTDVVQALKVLLPKKGLQQRHSIVVLFLLHCWWYSEFSKYIQIMQYC